MTEEPLSLLNRSIRSRLPRILVKGLPPALREAWRGCEADETRIDGWREHDEKARQIKAVGEQRAGRGTGGGGRTSSSRKTYR